MYAGSRETPPADLHPESNVTFPPRSHAIGRLAFTDFSRARYKPSNQSGAVFRRAALRDTFDAMVDDRDWWFVIG